MKKAASARRRDQKKKILRYAGRAGIVLLTLVVFIVAGLYSVMLVLAKGPSPTARDLFVRSVMETSAAKFLARMYFSESEIDEIISVVDESNGDEKTDTDLIKLPNKDKDKTPETLPFGSGGSSVVTPPDGEDTTPPETTPADPDGDDGVEIVDIKGSTFYGKMIIVKDPSRVIVGTLENYGEGYKGKSLRKFIKDTGALGGINAGGFWDEGGGGTGSIPDGIVIHEGKIAWGSPSTKYRCVVGFDKNHILHVGNMTGKQALERGIVEGLSFSMGPVLIQNGVPETTKHKLGGGLNPRTAIGQRADGAILLLVVNGRQANAMGATHDDTCNVLASYGAVNAANLDGGSSSLMIYKGETLNQSAYIFGERKLPDAFLIMPK